MQDSEDDETEIQDGQPDYNQRQNTDELQDAAHFPAPLPIVELQREHG
jgi:hypothetical protein